MTEQGGCADNAHSVEPREAQRPTLLAARTPQAAPPGNRDRAVGARWTATHGLPGGPTSLARHVGAVAQLPGASRRSIPSFRGETENGIRAVPPPGKQKEREKRSVDLALLEMRRANHTPGVMAALDPAGHVAILVTLVTILVT
jgi:hypothetical protein